MTYFSAVNLLSKTLEYRSCSLKASSNPEGHNCLPWCAAPNVQDQRLRLQMGRQSRLIRRCFKSCALIGITVSRISHDFAVLQLNFLASVAWSQS